MNGDPAVVSVGTVEERSAVETALRRRDLTPSVRERLKMVKAAALGQDLEGIARWSGRTLETVRHWLRRYRADGIAAVADAPRAGRPPKADGAYLAALEQSGGNPTTRAGLALRCLGPQVA